jgi:hypothetical protein
MAQFSLIFDFFNVSPILLFRHANVAMSWDVTLTPKPHY